MEIGNPFDVGGGKRRNIDARVVDYHVDSWPKLGRETAERMRFSQSATVDVPVTVQMSSVGLAQLNSNSTGKILAPITDAVNAVRARTDSSSGAPLLVRALSAYYQSGPRLNERSRQSAPKRSPRQ